MDKRKGAVDIHKGRDPTTPRSSNVDGHHDSDARRIGLTVRYEEDSHLLCLLSGSGPSHSDRAMSCVLLFVPHFFSPVTKNKDLSLRWSRSSV